MLYGLGVVDIRRRPSSNMSETGYMAFDTKIGRVSSKLAA